VGQDSAGPFSVCGEKADLNALLAKASVEQDGEKLRELAEATLTAMSRGEAAKFTE